MEQKNQINPAKVIIGPVRLSYLHVFEPVAIGEGSEKKYSVSIIIPKGDKKTVNDVEKAVKAALDAGKTAKFGGAIPKKLKLPLRDGDEEREDEAYENSLFLNASCKTKPGVVNRNLQPIIDENELYSGCYGYVSITFYAFDTNGNKGIACGLNNVMKYKDGEPLGGRVSAEADFGGINLGDDDDML
jgi:hypothetical protein